MFLNYQILFCPTRLREASPPCFVWWGRWRSEAKGGRWYRGETFGTIGSHLHLGVDPKVIESHGGQWRSWRTMKDSMQRSTGRETQNRSKNWGTEEFYWEADLAGPERKCMEHESRMRVNKERSENLFQGCYAQMDDGGWRWSAYEGVVQPSAYSECNVLCAPSIYCTSICTFTNRFASFGAGDGTKSSCSSRVNERRQSVNKQARFELD